MILDCVVVVVVVLRTHLGFHFQKKKLELPKTIFKCVSCDVKNGIKCHVIKKEKKEKEKWHCLQHNDAYTLDEAMEINVSLPTNNMED